MSCETCAASRVPVSDTNACSSVAAADAAAMSRAVPHDDAPLVDDDDTRATRSTTSRTCEQKTIVPRAGRDQFLHDERRVRVEAVSGSREQPLRASINADAISPSLHALRELAQALIHACESSKRPRMSSMRGRTVSGGRWCSDAMSSRYSRADSDS